MVSQAVILLNLNFLALSFSPLSMLLNRVIVPTVPTVMHAAVRACVCVWALLLQGPDSHEVCLNRARAQRPCSFCRVWNWIIEPSYSVSICLCLFDIFFTHMLFVFFAQFVSLFASFVCSVSAPGRHHRSAVFFLSNLPCDRVICMHVIPPAI